MTTSDKASSPDSPGRRDPRDPRRLIRFGVVVLLTGVVLMWLLFAVRSTLLTIYISALFAMGISPLVRLLERPRVSWLSSRLPRWLAILIIYAAIIAVIVAIAAAVVPPLVEQFEELWWAMGVPYFYVLALISAVGEMIPMVGPILAAIPAILVAATVSPGLALGVALFFIVQQQLENTILVPKIMGRQVGLSAVTVIIALGIGSQLLGVVGAILSVPTAAILQVLFEELVARDE